MSHAESNALSAILVRLKESPQDSETWSEFFQRTWPFVLVQSRTFLGRSTRLSAAEDVAQNVFWLLSRAAHDGGLKVPKEDAGVLELLKVIARNQAYDALRSEHRARRDIQRQVDFPEEGIAQTETFSPHARLEQSELIEQLMATLDSFDREVLRGLMAGQSLNEIAAKLDTSVKTIRRHHRHIQTVRDQIDIAAENLKNRKS
jgi:RNA polymerase sigma factor (sigma-70 family)